MIGEPFGEDTAWTFRHVCVSGCELAMIFLRMNAEKSPGVRFASEGKNLMHILVCVLRLSLRGTQLLPSV